ncbi:hypothetical protein [Streptomyces lydicus]|uniref:hypothetical protein n=1 Tax=Streptomyces lydicus TaxID=47763 RepID=UPI003794C46C
MTDHTGRAGLEREGLYAVAPEFDKLRTKISVRGAPSGLPHLTTASKQLATLAGLTMDLSEAVQYSAENDAPELDLGRVINAYTLASLPAGPAMENYTQAYAQLGFLRRFAEAHATANLQDARLAAFCVFQERVTYIRDDLKEAANTLRGSTDSIDGTTPRILAALSRSARPTNSAYRIPPEPRAPAPTPTWLADTPAPAMPADLTALPTSPLIGSLCSGYGGLDLGVQAALGAARWPGMPRPTVGVPDPAPPLTRRAQPRRHHDRQLGRRPRSVRPDGRLPLSKTSRSPAAAPNWLTAPGPACGTTSSVPSTPSTRAWW